MAVQGMCEVPCTATVARCDGDEECMMSKKMMLAAAAVAGVALAGCSGEADTRPDWREGLRQELAQELDPQDVTDFCAGVVMFGLETPEQIGALVLGFADGELPPGSTTVGEWVEDEGGDLSLGEWQIDPDTTVREIAVEAGRVMLAECGL